jgi:hypothetical protein
MELQLERCLVEFENHLCYERENFLRIRKRREP